MLKLKTMRESSLKCVFFPDEKIYSNRIINYRDEKLIMDKDEEEFLERMEDVVRLNHVEKNSTITMEKVIGKELSLFYSFSVIIIEK